MYGEFVKVDLGDGMTVDVFVCCNPDTPGYLKQRMALEKLKRKIDVRLRN